MKQCPHCHKMNPSSARFCKYCGTNLTNVKASASSITDSNSQGVNSQSTQSRQVSSSSSSQSYNKQWERVNKSSAQTNDLVGNYFTWLKDTFIHPERTSVSHPAFGAISFAVEAVLLIITSLISSGNEQIANIMMNMKGYLPISAFYNASGNISKPICVILASIMFFAVYIVIGFLVHLFEAKDKKNIVYVMNLLAGYSSFNIILTLALLVSVLIQSVMLSWLLPQLIFGMLLIGLAIMIFKDNNKTNVDRVFITIVSWLIYILVIGLVGTILAIIV